MKTGEEKNTVTVPIVQLNAESTVWKSGAEYYFLVKYFYDFEVKNFPATHAVLKKVKTAELKVMTLADFDEWMKGKEEVG